MKKKEKLEEALLLLSILVCGVLMMAMCSCSRKVVQDVQKVDSITIVKTDTVKIDNTVTLTKTEYRDRVRDRYVVVTTAGDTVKQVEKELVYIDINTQLKDSLAIYKAKADSLANIKKDNQKEVVSQYQSWWQRVKDKALELSLFTLGCIVLLWAISRKMRE